MKIFRLFVAFTLICFALLPSARAIVPPPDGGYPGGNTAEGQDALFTLDPTAGTDNTAVGYLSLRSDLDGQFNTAVGAGTLLANTGTIITGQGVENTAIGAAALLSNTTGSDNAAIGAFALFSNNVGSSNTATGASALFNDVGDLFFRGGSSNTATGAAALFSNTTGSDNTAIGVSALANNTTGIYNIALGFEAGENVTKANNVICIGTNVAGDNVDHSCYIGNIFGLTSSNGVTVLINSDGKLGTMTSSRRFKEEIKPMERTSEALFALKPVAFRCKKEIDPAGTPQLGLVAEEVEKVNPDLVMRDKDGKPYSVRYEAVNAMLLNEFLKEHRRVEKQETKIEQQVATIARLEQQIEALTAGLQKVSAQLEANKPAPQVVNNP